MWIRIRRRRQCASAERCEISPEVLWDSMESSTARCVRHGKHLFRRAESEAQQFPHNTYQAGAGSVRIAAALGQARGYAGQECPATSRSSKLTVDLLKWSHDIVRNGKSALSTSSLPEHQVLVYFAGTINAPSLMARRNWSKALEIPREKETL